MTRINSTSHEAAVAERVDAQCCGKPALGGVRARGGLVSGNRAHRSAHSTLGEQCGGGGRGLAVSWLLFAILGVAVPSLGAPSREAAMATVPPTSRRAERVLEADHRGQPRAFQVGRNAQEYVDLVTGEFETGLELRGEPKQRPLEAAARRFIKRHAELFELPAGYDASRLRFEPIHGAGQSDIVLEGYQTWRGLRIRESSFAFVFTGEGKLRGFTGLLRPETGFESDDRFGPERAAAVAVHRLGLGREALSIERPSGGRRLWATGPKGRRLGLERVVDTERGVVAWEVQSDTDRIYVDEVTGDAYDAKSLVRRRATRLKIRHNRYSPDLDLLSNSEGFDHQDVTRYVSWGWACFVRLEYGKAEGLSWAIERIRTRDGASQAEVFYPCDLAQPSFSASGWGSSHFRQQNTYYWIKAARDELIHGFLASSPSKTDSIRVHIDEPSDGKCPTVDPPFFVAGCFVTPIGIDFRHHPRIYLVKSRYNSWTAAHEYGHYFIWAYGDVNDRDLDDEIAETVAGLVMHSEVEGLYYGEVSNLHIYDQEPSRSLKQAIFEVLYGLNCDKSYCYRMETGSYGSGTLFNWSSRTAARRNLIKALAYALDATGKDVSRSYIRVYMYLWLLQNVSFEAAYNTNSVMLHHKF